MSSPPASCRPFSARRDVTPAIETFGRTDAEAAYERTAADEAWFRVVSEP